MKTFKDTPAFLRYFNARFKPVTNPIFLGSVGGLLVAGLAIYQYWQHPEWLQTSSDSLTNSPTVEQNQSSQTSSEDLAAAANIDNIDLLLKEIEQNNTLNAIAKENKNQSSELKREESAFSRFQKEQKARLSKAGTSEYANGLTPSSNGIGGGNEKIMELLQPPSFSSYQSGRNSVTTNKIGTSSKNIIPNPVGNIYLSNREQSQPANPIAPVNSAPGTGNLAAGNNNLAPNNNPTGNIAPTSNGQNPQLNNVPPVNTTVNNRFAPASSIIQSRQTLPAPITSSAITSSTNNFNSVNPNGATSFNSINSSGINNQGGNFVNGTNNVNGFNGVNGTTGNSNLNGIAPQSLQNPNRNGTVTRPNSIIREGSTVTGSPNDPNVLQNNYRSSRTITPSYNRSTPIGFQLQPQNNSPNVGLGQNNSLSGVTNPSNATTETGLINNVTNPNASQFTNNVPIAPLGTPTLQPSGVLSTSEIPR